MFDFALPSEFRVSKAKAKVEPEPGSSAVEVKRGDLDDEVAADLPAMPPLSPKEDSDSDVEVVNCSPERRLLNSEEGSEAGGSDGKGEHPPGSDACA